MGAPIRCSPRLPYQISPRIDLGVNLSITPDLNIFYFLSSPGLPWQDFTNFNLSPLCCYAEVNS
jgi:hypothetical protein